MKIGLATDHGGYNLKEPLMKALQDCGYEVQDFGAFNLEPDDDYPDFVAPMARAVAHGDVDRGIALCGSGIGASVAANKIPGVRAALIVDAFSAHQGVEDDDMNVICLGGRVVAFNLAWELVQTFLNSHYYKQERFERRLNKVSQLEQRKE